MPFNSYSYPAFLLLTVLLYWRLPRAWRPGLLILLGVVYYAAHDAKSLLLIGGLALLTYAVGRILLHRTAHPGICTAASVTLLVLVLTYFKYAGLLASTFGSFLSQPSSVPSIALPLGISFFTFEFIHYIVESGRGKIAPHRARDFFVFAFFFPTLISGPIKRFQQFHTSLDELRWRPEMFYTGTLFLLLGYGQKYLLSDPLIPFTQALAYPDLLTWFSASGGLLLYSFRIYFDFAGLSNIAVGSAMLLGILVPKNFDSPYLSTNLQDFWQRWHMSLSSWVRDYVYITLGGSRRGMIITSVNLLIVMAVVGLWHGSGWNFAAWGIWHGCGLAVHRLWRGAGNAFGSSLPERILGLLLTFSFVTVGWAFFVTTSLHDSIRLLSILFTSF